MLRKSTDEDISDEECNKVIDPFYDNYHTFIEEYVMPEVIAYYLANSFYRNAMWEATFLQHFNSASDMFNLISENYEKTKKEAEDAEFEFKIRLHNHENQSNMTFKDMIQIFVDYKKDKVKETTYYNYGNKRVYLEPLHNIKLKDFNIMQFESWKDYINSTHLSTKYKNDIYKFLNSIMNYATVWYEFNFTKVYPKMTNFTNPNETKKEMLFFTFEELSKFISHAGDLKTKVIYEILYYCGLRKGELRGLQWKDINFDKKRIINNKANN